DPKVRLHCPDDLTITSNACVSMLLMTEHQVPWRSRTTLQAASCRTFEHQFGMMMSSFQNKKEGLSREEQALTGKMSVVNR
ncbi:hypothetical protein LLF47_22335, partial [Escherichia coli]|nr:hypothetical protein [Escherichia coli]MCJ2975387.1 hypothetical protein [Escherichia coli]